MTDPANLRRTVAVLTASLVTIAAAWAVPAHAGDRGDDPCIGEHHDTGGVTVRATQDGQVVTGTDQGDVLDANGHLGVTVDGIGGNRFARNRLLLWQPR